jgi:hypothetical protein
MARLTPLLITKNIFLAVNGLVCQPMVTPLWTCLVLQGLIVFLLIQFYQFLLDYCNFYASYVPRQCINHQTQSWRALKCTYIGTRVARWYIFIPNPTILVGLGVQFLKIHVLWSFGIFYAGIIYFIFWQFGIIYGHLFYFLHFGILKYENLANLDRYICRYIQITAI